MQSNSELANSWNIKQNSEEHNTETDIEDDVNEISAEEPTNSNKSLTKYDFIFQVQFHTFFGVQKFSSFFIKKKKTCK